MESQDHIEQVKIDHELLIRIDEKLKNVLTDIKELKDNLNNRVEILEKNKANLIEVADHETRIRRLETWGAMAIGGLAIFQLLLKFFIK